MTMGGPISGGASNSHNGPSLHASREDVVVGLDIGTTKVCTVVGNGDPNGKINILGVGVVPSRGLKKGVVIDVEDTVVAIRESVERARHMAGMELRAAVAGVTGEHIQSSNKRGSVTVAGAGGVITADDVERVLQAAAVDVPRDREIIHSLPRDFSVDGHKGVRRPIGMCGQRLEVETHVVTGTASFLQNVVQCVERAGLVTEALVLEPIATSEAITTSDERELGVALIDIGGGTSDIAVFSDGSIIFSDVLPVGGTHVTRDISIGLRTPLDTAERLKIERGVASPELIPHGEALEVVTAGSGERLRLPRAVLGEIIEARMTELFEMARDRLWNAGVQKRLPAGIILTGGGALLPGAAELASQVFEMSVRLGRPIEITGWSDQVEAPQFSTAVGLLRFALRQRAATALTGVSAGLPISNDLARRVWSNPPQAAPGASGQGQASAPTSLSAPPPAPTQATQTHASPPAEAPRPASNVPVLPTPPAIENDIHTPTPFDRLTPNGAKAQAGTNGPAISAIPAVAALSPAEEEQAQRAFKERQQREQEERERRERIAQEQARAERAERERLQAQAQKSQAAQAATEPSELPADAPWWKKLLFRIRQLVGFEMS